MPLKRLLIVCALTVGLSAEAKSSDRIEDLREPASHLAARVTGLLSQVDSLLIKAVRDAQRVDVPLLIRHASLTAGIRDMDGIRAVLVADPSGDLILDSYNWPTPPINLAGRSYIRQAQAQPGTVIVGELVSDARSGVPFVPVSRTYDGWTAVAVVNEGAFWRDLCGRCYGFITAGGKVTSTQPQGIRGYDDMAKRLSVGGEGTITENKRTFSYLSKRIESADLAIILLYDH